MALPDDKETMFRRFIEKGNVVVGRPAKIIGDFGLFEYQSGSTIIFGDGVILRGGTMQFPLGGGKLELANNVVYRAITHVGPGSVVTVGRDTRFNRDCEVHAWEGASIEIGSGCLFSNVKIRTSDLHSIYDLSTKKRLNRSRDVFLGDRVWVGEGAIIGKGTNVESGSVIGAYSVTTGHIPKNCIAAGVPAKVIRRNVYWERHLDMTSPRALPSKQEYDGDRAPHRGWLRSLFSRIKG